MNKLMTIVAMAAALASGCAVVKGRAGDSSYMGFAFGEKASATLAGLAIVETQGEGGILERSVGIEQAGAQSETKLIETFGRLLLAGLSAQGAPGATGTPAASMPAVGCADGDCE